MPTNPPSRPQPRLITPASGTSGPIYEYRGATIHSNGAGTNFVVSLTSHSGSPQASWGGLTHLGAAVRAIDLWLDTGKLPIDRGD